MNAPGTGETTIPHRASCHRAELWLPAWYWYCSTVSGLASVTYAAVHQRLRKQRGSASQHRCVDCENPAAEWSYDHADPDELVDSHCGVPVRYSIDLNHYAPRCKVCHAYLDISPRIDEQRCIELYGRGLSVFAIAPLVGFSPSGVWVALRRCGVQLRPAIAGRQAADWTNCLRGHPLVEPNLVPSKKPRRRCLACQRAICSGGYARRCGRPWTVDELQAQADAHCDAIFGDMSWRDSAHLVR